MTTTRALICICASLASGHVLGATLTAADLAPNDLIVTEYLANPIGVSDSVGEYFEIFNTTASTIDLDGLVVRDDGSNSFTIGALMLGPLSFAVLSAGDGNALGFSPDWVYGSAMALTNADDEIGLYRPDDSVVHKVVYDDGDFYGAGIAHELGLVSVATPTLITGPAAGTAYVAASLALGEGNLGSPGAAGNSQIDLPVVPIPAAAWLFGGALAALGRLRRSATAPQ